MESDFLLSPDDLPARPHTGSQRWAIRAVIGSTARRHPAERHLDVYAFGTTTDFRSKLFPGSRRLVELADRVEVLRVEALCWCGARRHAQRPPVDCFMVVEGAQVVVGDVNQADTAGHEVLCGRHHRRRTTATSARGRPVPDVLSVQQI